MTGEAEGQASTGAAWSAARVRALFWTHVHSLAEEAQNAAVLWIVVAFAAGIGSYFALAHEPPLLVSLIPALTCAVAAWRRPARSGSRLFFSLLTAASVGLAWPTLYAARVDTPILAQRTRPLALEARVMTVEDRGGGSLRFLLAVDDAAGLAARQRSAKVRLTARTDAAGVLPGDRVRLRAVLWPPPPPSFPGDYDLGREFYFQGIGALGIAVSPIVKVSADGGFYGFSTVMERTRAAISERLRHALPGEAGLVADALITGFRGAMPPDLSQAMRDAGLAHIMAISGLHMAMVAGLVFFTVRFLLATAESWALRYPIKKWAAAAAIAATFFYLMVSGARVPAERAFVMTSLALVAVILDRRAISLRLVALAAAAVLLLSPVALTSISFQMSFAAVIALVAFYEHYRDKGWQPPWRGGGLLSRGVGLIAAAVVTTLVSEAAVAPATLYHFSVMPFMGIVANAVAIPLLGSLIMPLLLLGLALMPLGLEALPLELAGRTIALVIEVARWSADGATGLWRISAMPLAAYAVMMAGGLWLALWKHSVRHLGIVGILVGIWLAWQAKLPDIWVAGEGNLAAVRLANGSYALTPGRAQKWERSRVAQWSAKETTTWPDHGVSTDRRLSCDGLGCVYRPPSGHTVALLRQADALADDCRNADVIVADMWLPRACAGPDIKIGRGERRDNGGYAVWFERAEIRVKTVGAQRNGRPWGGYRLDTKAQSTLRRHSRESGPEGQRQQNP